MNGSGISLLDILFVQKQIFNELGTQLRLRNTVALSTDTSLFGTN